jgi:predicted RNase H-like nuclease
MNAPEDRFGLVIQDTLDALTDRAFPGCPKADMPCDLPPPTFGERRHRGLARRRVAVRRRSIFMLAQRPASTSTAHLLARPAA